MKLLAQGAEAKIFVKGKNVIKDRVSKSYRINEIDKKLRKSRTNREGNVLQKLHEINFPAPALIRTNKFDILEIEYLKGDKLSKVLEKKNFRKISQEIGKSVAILHNNSIIHGDLTTSNLILRDKVYFIDFGLSFFSHRIEDKAADLHLFQCALESKHYTIWKECFKIFLTIYKKYGLKSNEVISRLGVVDSRGKNKVKKFK